MPGDSKKDFCIFRMHYDKLMLSDLVNTELSTLYKLEEISN